MPVHFEFDSANQILLARVVGPVNDTAVPKIHEAARKLSLEKNPRAGIVDLSGITSLNISTGILEVLAKWEPAMAPMSRPRFVVAPADHVFGLTRIFQTIDGRARPQFHVVRTVEEVYRALGVESPQFEPLEILETP